MGGDAECIDPERSQIQGQLPEGLRGIRVHEDPRFAGDLCNLAHRLHGADLVVGQHDARGQGVGLKRVAESLNADEPVAVDREDVHFKAERAQMLCGL